MAKHAHRLILNQKKTWRCTLTGCSYFIHVGLDHILPGKRMKCFDCGEEFTVNQDNVDEAKDGDDMLRCTECRMTEKTGLSKTNRDDMAEKFMEKYGIKNESSDPVIRALDRLAEKAKKRAEPTPEPPTIHESVDEHLSDCASVCFIGMECDCKNEVR